MSTCVTTHTTHQINLATSLHVWSMSVHTLKDKKLLVQNTQYENMIKDNLLYYIYCIALRHYVPTAKSTYTTDIANRMTGP